MLLIVSWIVVDLIVVAKQAALFDSLLRKKVQSNDFERLPCRSQPNVARLLLVGRFQLHKRRNEKDSRFLEISTWARVPVTVEFQIIEG